MKCSLCDGEIEPHLTPEGKVYWTKGHSAEPLNDGRCCDSCEAYKVMPARIATMSGLIDVKKLN